MNAKNKITFEVTVGTNDDKITEETLVQKLFDTELLFNNSNPNMRMHITEKSEPSQVAK